MEEFSIVGTLMGTLGIFCLNPQHNVCSGASEGLHYLFTVLVLHRSEWRAPGWPCGRGDTLTSSTSGQQGASPGGRSFVWVAPGDPGAKGELGLQPL